MSGTDSTKEVEIFASAWPAHLGEGAASDAEPRDEIFACAWPSEIAVEVDPLRELDALWEAFDASLGDVLARGRCPHCDSFLDVDLGETLATCTLCGSTFATLHAGGREGQA